MRVALGVMLALGGCDYLFQLDSLTVPVPPDASTIDVAAGCFSTDNGDEDQDGALDGCDACPLVRDDQTDTDTDGVGDACDPNPTMPLEQIAFFHPMKSLNRAEWAIFGAHATGWQTSSVDGIQQPAKGNNDFVRTYLRILRDFQQPYIQVKVASAGPDDDAIDRSAVAVYAITGDDAAAGNPDGVLCGLDFPDAVTPSNPSAFAEVVGFGPLKIGVEEPAPPALITISMLQYADAETPVVAKCYVRPDGANEVLAPVSAAVSPRNVKVGMWTQNASATFVGIFVTERRP